jgi:hypothetical protein
MRTRSAACVGAARVIIPATRFGITSVSIPLPNVFEFVMGLDQPRLLIFGQLVSAKALHILQCLQESLELIRVCQRADISRKKQAEATKLSALAPRIDTASAALYHVFKWRSHRHPTNKNDELPPPTVTV